MIKILYYLPNLGLGGTEKTAILFAKHLSRDKFDVGFVYKGNGDMSRESEIIRSIDHSWTIWDDVAGAGNCPMRLQDVIDSYRPEIFHVFRSGYLEWPEPGRDIQNFGKFVETNVFGMHDPNPLIDKTLYMSEWLMLAAGREVGGRFDFVNNPVLLPATWKTMDLDIPEHTMVLGRVGRPDDGIYTPIAIQASAVAKDNGVKLHWLVVAPPPRMIEDLEKFDLPYTVVEPTVDPVALSMAYNTMDVYCHQRADGETFGVNIAEAMIHKLPVITHQAIPSHPNMGVFQSQMTLVDHKSTGLLTGGSVRSYYNAIRDMSSMGPRRRSGWGMNGYEKAMEEYHITPVIEKLSQIYEEIV